MNSLLRASLVPLAAWACAVSLPAQWSQNPAQNLSIADRNGEQSLPKLAATTDGGCYVAWFDNSAGSYAVWMQRLDAAGVEQWPHDGILVSNQPQSSSLVDWDLITDSAGNAVVTFTDVRAGSDLDVYAYRIAPNGTMLWGTNGITLSANGDYEANPRVVETSLGNFVFVWSRSLSAGSGSIELQQLDPAGNRLFGPAGVSIPGDPGATPGFATIVAADAGSVIVAWMRDISFRGNRYLHVQKVDAAGGLPWGTTPLQAFDTTSLPIAHQVKMVGDGAGGAWLAWHFAPLTSFSTRVQHVSAGGAELLPHNGVDVSTEANISKLDPALFLAPDVGGVIVIFNVRDSSQGQRGVAIQKLDGGGNLLWGATGVRLAALDGVVESFERAVPYAGGALAFWFEQPGATPPLAIRGARVDAAGQIVWGSPPLLVSTAAAEKLRLTVDVSPTGVALLAWSDRRRDSGDILVQNVNPDGTLGANLADLRVYGCGVNPAGSMTVSGSAAIGRTMQFALDNPLGTQSPTATTALLAFAFAPAAGYPCGVQLPGWGMAGPGAVGELLLDATRIVGPAVTATPWGGPGLAATVTLSVPLDPGLAGGAFYAQGVLVAPGAPSGLELGLTNAAAVRLGF
ncbi:MAG: hypothetical protein IPM29_28045 [Planctomycetes bacterium]|nr:hypothetical protein [Planctomycetota bacterium]